MPIVGESRILGTSKAKSNRNNTKGYSSSVGREKRIKEKRISLAADIPHQVEVSCAQEVSSPKSSQGSTMTQVLLSSDHSKTAKEVPGSFFRRSNNNRGSFRTFSSHMATSKLPPGSVLVSDRGVFRLTAKEKPFACGYCGKTYKVKHAVYGHIVQQHEEKRYSCEFCGKRFAEACVLAMHVTVHTQEKPITCDQCGMRFRLASTLRLHKYTHSEERPFSCNECNKSFKTRKLLSCHRRVHNKEGQKVACSICKVELSAYTNLKEHMMIHTGEKPFKCTFCEKQFRTKMMLRNHLNVHSGERIPMHVKKPCSVCGKTCWESYMPTHMRMHTGEKPFECNVCGKRFPKKQNLEGHMKSHTGEKPFACDRCDKRFALYSNMVTHKAKCMALTENVG